MKKIILFIALLAWQSTYSLQQSSKRLARLTPQAAQTARPSIPRPVAAAAMATQAGQNQVPAPAPTRINLAITNDYRPTPGQPFVTQVKQRLWQREREKVSLLKQQEAVQIMQKLGHPKLMENVFSLSKNSNWWEYRFFPNIPIDSAGELADFFKLVDLFYTASPPGFNDWTRFDLPRNLSRAFTKLPEEAKPEWISAVKNWLVAHPHAVKLMLGDVTNLEHLKGMDKSGHLEGNLKYFLEPYFLEAYEELVQDFRYRPFILDFFKQADITIKQTSLVDDYLLGIFVEQKKLPKLAFYLSLYGLEELFTLQGKLHKNRLLRKALGDFRNNPGTLSQAHFSKVDQEEFLEIYRSRGLEQFMAALDKEADLLKKGYICFYHGQRLSSARGNDIANKLFFRLVGVPQPNDFYFKQFLPGDLTIGVTPKTYMSEALKRHALAMQERKWRSKGNVPTISANLFAFGNIKNPGSHTLSYVARNTNVTSVDTGAPLYDLGIPNYILEKIRPELSQIDRQSREATARLVLIAVPLKILDANVYPVVWGYNGGRGSTSVQLGGRVLKNISAIVNAVAKGGEQDFYKLDNFEVAIPLSSAGLLNPYSGIKLFNFDPEPSSAPAAEKLHKTIDEVVDTIMAELEKSGDLAQLKKNAKRFYDLLPELAREGKDLVSQDTVD